MPTYPGTAQSAILYENQQAFLLSNEQLGAGIASKAFQLRRTRGASYPFGASFEISFSGAPGIFQVDIQTSDSDADANFVSIATLNGGLNASNVGRIELPSFWAKYVRAKIVQLTNAVNTTVLVTR